MNNTLLARMGTTLMRLQTLIIVIGFMYVLSLTAGAITGYSAVNTLHSYLAEQDEKKSAQIEKLFGPFREPVRQGQITTMAACTGSVFLLNMLGALLSILSSIFFVPILFTLVFGGWCQGMCVAQAHASSFLSLFLFLFMGGLEWITYPLATVAGLNIGLSFLFPKRQQVTSRWLAFKLAWRDAGRLYLFIALILAVQAVAEILYVRKVLLMGGSGVPLMPY